MSEKIEIDIPSKLLGGIDAMVDGVSIKNRREAVESILDRSITGGKVKKAVILAGGRGTRMRPFTYEIPKPLIPVQGKPLIQHTIDLLMKYNIREVIFSIGYLGDKIREHFGNGNKFGVKISYVEEEEALGTAGPLNLMKDQLNESFIMFNGDILANIDLFDFIKFHTRHRGLATIALKNISEPSGYGAVKMEGSVITEFMEKPQEQLKHGLINAGVYVMEPEVVEYIPKGKVMMEHDVFPRLAEEGKLYGYPFKGQWLDTGTHESYEKAIKEWNPPK
ncbi:MAG: nucleotidyltransferase family protein [Candidatus Altiarchaeota archaeon]|nr:nucleotidyltransferase family protein [Candidatus Altiarchaeota archaeon]